MAITIHNLTELPVALPTPIEAVLSPRQVVAYEYIEYDTVINDGRIAGLVAKGIIRIDSEDVGVGPRSWYSNAIVVAQENGDYASIQAAIDAAPPFAGFGTGTIIQIYPGFYQENITMRSGVVLVGMGADLFAESTIYSTSGVAVTWPDGAILANIYNMSVISQDASGADARLFRFEGSVPSVSLRNCFVAFNDPVDSRIAIDVIGDDVSLVAVDTKFQHRDTTATAGTGLRRLFNITGNNFRFDMRDGDVSGTHEDPDDDMTLFDIAADGLRFQVHGCHLLEMDCRDVTHTGEVSIMRYRGGPTASTVNFLECFTRVNSDSAGSTIRIFDVDSTSDDWRGVVVGGTLRSGGAGTSEVAALGAGDWLDAYETQIESMGISSGAGQFRYSGVVDDLAGSLRMRTNLAARFDSDTIAAPNLKSGADQGAAGAAAGEMWVDTSAGNVIKLGV